MGSPAKVPAINIEADGDREKSWNYISNGESREMYLNFPQVQSARSSDSEERQVIASGKLVSRKKKGPGRDESLQS